MMLVELGTVPSATFPVSELSNHMHLGSGFVDDGSQDELLEAYLRSAIAAIETRIGKAVFQRTFSWTLTRWSDCAKLGLPVAPVQSVQALKVFSQDGTETLIDPDRYVLHVDTQRPSVVSTSSDLPSIPSNGYAEIEFLAGYATSWDGVPAALRHAILMQAAHYYESKSGCGDRYEMPLGVMALISGFRPVRLGGVGA